MKLFLIVGARPNFVKSVSIIEALSRCEDIDYKLIHTGQHYDYNMSGIFFSCLKIHHPFINLGVGSNSHAVQTAEIMKKLDHVFEKENPDIAIVVGDVNSTLAGALVASKRHCGVAHVEAGLRSYNRLMPEEVNRVLTDHISDYLFCPTEQAISNLENEGIRCNVFFSGDTMYDIYLKSIEIARKMELETGSYCLVTVHRAENTDDINNLKNIVTAINSIAENETVVFPLHPRTKRKISEFDIDISSKVRLLPPVGYLQMLSLEIRSSVILTDSGGIQKEAYFSKVPCITMREETEWVETIQMGCNCLTSADTERILEAYYNAKKPGKKEYPSLYGNGKAGEKIVSALKKVFSA